MHPTKTMRLAVTLIFFTAWLATLPASRAATPTEGFVPLGEAHSFKDAPTVTEWRFEDVRGPSPFDKIGLHDVTVGKTPPERPEIVVLYLPTHGVDFWAMDYRTHYVSSDKTGDDLKELKGWTYDLFAGDIDEAVKFVRARTHRCKIFLAGF